MSLRAGMYRQKAAEAKRRAAKAKKTVPETGIRRWRRGCLVLAEQIEWIDNLKLPQRLAEIGQRASLKRPRFVLLSRLR
jgi:hypothetical protein